MFAEHYVNQCSDNQYFTAEENIGWASILELVLIAYVLFLYVPVDNFSVMLGQVLLG